MTAEEYFSLVNGYDLFPLVRLFVKTIFQSFQTKRYNTLLTDGVFFFLFVYFERERERERSQKSEVRSQKLYYMRIKILGTAYSTYLSPGHKNNKYTFVYIYMYKENHHRGASTTRLTTATINQSIKQH